MTPDIEDPMAWLAFAVDGSESCAVYMMHEEAQAAADAWGWQIMPLYLAARLTDDERQVIEEILVDPDSAPADSALTLRGLLERLK
jgi:hypothetical protein